MKDPKELVVVKEKSKTGVVERLHDDNTLIVKDLFKKETNLDIFNRLKGKNKWQTGKNLAAKITGFYLSSKSGPVLLDRIFCGAYFRYVGFTGVKDRKQVP